MFVIILLGNWKMSVLLLSLRLSVLIFESLFNHFLKGCGPQESILGSSLPYFLNIPKKYCKNSGADQEVFHEEHAINTILLLKVHLFIYLFIYLKPRVALLIAFFSVIYAVFICSLCCMNTL